MSEAERDRILMELEERIKRLEERLNKLDPPRRFNSIEEYARWRDSHGGGMATAMVIKDGERALKKLMEGADPSEAPELMRRIKNALSLQDKIHREDYTGKEEEG